MTTKQIRFYNEAQEAREYAASLRADGENRDYVRREIAENYSESVYIYLMNHQDI